MNKNTVGCAVYRAQIRQKSQCKEYYCQNQIAWRKNTRLTKTNPQESLIADTSKFEKQYDANSQ